MYFSLLLADFLWFHIKASGDFTRHLRQYFTKKSEIQQKILSSEAITVDPAESKEAYKTSRAPENSRKTVGHLDIRVFLDGPYRAASTELYNCEHAVLICGGIGITPFASVLGSLLEKFRQVNHSICPNCEHEFPSISAAEPMRISGCKLKLKKVDFIWVVREARSIEYFADLLRDWKEAQTSLAKSSSRLFMECKIFITASDAESQKSYVRAYFDDSTAGVVLKQGRPKWSELFADINRQKLGELTVFYCGPYGMKQHIRNLCGYYNYGFTWENFY